MISDAELSLHGPDSGAMWVVIDGEVYDVTSIVQSHPGGIKPLIESAGKDATRVFHGAGHSERAVARLHNLRVGTCSGAKALRPYEAGNYVAAHGMVSEGNCNGWYGCVLGHMEAAPGVDAVLVYFPEPMGQLRVLPENLRLPDPTAGETVVIRKEPHELLGLAVQGRYILGQFGGLPSRGVGRLTRRWLLSVNGEPPPDETGVVYFNCIGLEEVEVCVGGMAPYKGDIVRYRHNGMESVGRCVGITNRGYIAVSPESGLPGIELEPEDVTLIPQVEPGTFDSPAEWHSKRRNAMLRAHPQIESLPKHQPWSVVVALVCSALHFSLGVWAGELTWFQVFLLAYTAGAMCKMGQFAMGHEFCHGVVSPYFDSPLARSLMLRAINLPSVSCGLYNYYAHHHMGHHALLGAQSFVDAVEEFKDGGEIDGDIFHSYAAQLRPFIGQRNAQDQEVRTGWNRRALYMIPKPLRPAMRLARDNIIFVVHFGIMMFWSFITACVSVALFFCKRFENKREEFQTRSFGMKREMMEVGLQSYLWVACLLLMCYMVGDLVKCLGTLLYLVLSELFLNGFLLHPFGAYFLGVHKTAPGVVGVEGEVGRHCQPTQSCYASKLFQLVTFNLTMHVEHHDFPNLPWTSLPKLFALAPEFYRSLESLPSPITTLFEYYCTDEQWSYGCGT